MSGRRIRVFVSYAHANRDAVELLLDHLGWLENDERIELFDDRKLIAGEEWDKRLRHEIAVADIVLFVVTAKFMSSPYCTKVELKEVLRRREAEGICVIPILAETCAWTSMPLAELQAYQRDDSLQLKPLNKWGNDVDVALPRRSPSRWRPMFSRSKTWFTVVGSDRARPRMSGTGDYPYRQSDVTAARRRLRRSWLAYSPSRRGRC